MAWVAVVVMLSGYFLAGILRSYLPGFVPGKLIFGLFVACAIMSSVLAGLGTRWISGRGRVFETAFLLFLSLFVATVANAQDLALWLFTSLPFKSNPVPNVLIVVGIVIGTGGITKLAALCEVNLGARTFVFYLANVLVYVLIGGWIAPELTGRNLLVTDNPKEVVFGLIYTLLVCFVSAISAQIWLEARGRLQQVARSTAVGTMVLALGCELYAAAFVRFDAAEAVMQPAMVVLAVGYALMGAGVYRVGNLVVEYFDPAASDLPPTAALVEIFGNSIGFAVYQHLLQRFRETESARIRAATEAELRASTVRQLESEVERRRDAESQLQRALADVEAAGRAKADFLAMVSHELRTPVAVMIAYSGMLADGIVAGDRSDGLNVREVGSRIRRSGDALLGLVEGLLDTSRADVGRFRADIRPVQLVAELEPALAFVRRESAAKGLECQVSLPDRSVVAIIDPGAVNQVLFNLLGNACRYTARGSVSFAVTVSGHDLSMVVRDTGSGIAPADLERVFSPFAQVSSGSGQRSGVGGLGLSICRRVVTMLGGTLKLESSVGQGTTVTVNFPGVIDPVVGRTAGARDQ